MDDVATVGSAAAAESFAGGAPRPRPHYLLQTHALHATGGQGRIVRPALLAPVLSLMWRRSRLSKPTTVSTASRMLLSTLIMSASRMKACADGRKGTRERKAKRSWSHSTGTGRRSAPRKQKHQPPPVDCACGECEFAAALGLSDSRKQNARGRRGVGRAPSSLASRSVRFSICSRSFCSFFTSHLAAHQTAYISFQSTLVPATLRSGEPPSHAWPEQRPPENACVCQPQPRTSTYGS